MIVVGVEIGGDDPKQAELACEQARRRGWRVVPYKDLTAAARDLRDGQIHALVAPGDTKEAARQVLGAIRPPQIYRPKDNGKWGRSLLLPPIALVLPNSRLGRFVMCDAGAQTKVTAQDLYLNLLLGTQCAWQRLGIRKPTVALLHIGEEEHKLRPIDQEVLKLAREGERLGFFRLFGSGIAEASHVMSGQVDVVVCSGWDGNVALKWCESGLKLLIRSAKSRLQSWPLRLLGLVALIFALPALVIASPILLPVLRHFRPSLYSGGLIAGLDKPFLICHGSSDAKDILGAIERARGMAALCTAAAIQNVVFTQQLPAQLPEWLSPPSGGAVQVEEPAATSA